MEKQSRNSNWIWALAIVGYFLFLEDKVPGDVLRWTLNITLFILMVVILIDQILIVRNKWRK
ncbi:hypothetical protein ACMG4J_22725 [Rossellomorea marisflavi]|uniref:hypothetical protein n=1 Tax=Rossellomorea marisflavi TaxID=189381 RepID=UPI0039BF9A56